MSQSNNSLIYSNFQQEPFGSLDQEYFGSGTWRSHFPLPL